MISGNLIFVFFSVTLGASFQFGYQTGVINQPLGLIQSFINNVTYARSGYTDDGYAKTIASLCVSSFLVGGMLGGISGGYLGKKFGRRNSLLLLAPLCIIGCIIMMTSQIAKSFEMIILGRLLVGIACGGYTAIGPLYLSEVAPLSIRGAAGSLNQLVIVLAILISQILGLPMLMGTETLWPILLGLNMIACIVSCFCLLFCPESPRYLYLIKGDLLKTQNALHRLRGDGVSIQQELDDLKNESEGIQEKLSVISLFRVPHLRCALFVVIIAQLGQQLSGINGILYYSVDLFKANGLSDIEATFANLGIGATLFVITLVSVFIVDRAGRRILLIGGLILVLACLITFTIALIIRDAAAVTWPIYLAIAMIYFFICGFGIGAGAIPWFITAEMFSQKCRDAAMSVAVLVNWLCNIVVGLVFIQLITFLSIYAFLPFIVITSVVVVLLFLYLPETKGRSASSIEAEFREGLASGGCCFPIRRAGEHRRPSEDRLRRNSEIPLTDQSDIEVMDH